MPTPQELEAKFWKSLGSDRTMMLGLDGVDDGHTRPMTAQFENDRSPIYFFTVKDNELVKALSGNDRAIATLRVQGPRPVCDRPWSAVPGHGSRDD